MGSKNARLSGSDYLGIARHGEEQRIRVGISACLLGHQVRFDGSHKRDRFLTDALGAHVQWVTVCPEVGSGMGIPRPTLRLLGQPDGQDPRLVTSKSGEDWTDRIEAYSRAACDHLIKLDLCGFVLKSRSPTCGMERVKVYDRHGIPHKQGVGVFARIVRQAHPGLPIEEEGRLRDPALREAFLDAVFAYARWRALGGRDASPAELIDFHRRSKYQLRAQSPSHSVELGRMVARAGRRDRERLCAEYGSIYMEAMNVRATPRRHANTMRRLAGYLERHISRGARQLLHESIDDYCEGIDPRSVPIALIRSHARETGLTYLSDQTYLEPYPKTLRRR